MMLRKILPALQAFFLLLTAVPGFTQTKQRLEPHRPIFHFTPPSKWMNDPNGMFFYQGEYHLHYQYYPEATVWGPMHWGHAVSRDLIHWQHLPISLYPDSLGYIFSGSAVVDWKNTSGFGKGGEPPLVAIFTHHHPEMEKTGSNNFQYQSIAYSNDKGRTWTKYAQNPVVPNLNHIRDFRDPKVIWDDHSKQWIMTFAAYDHVKFWGSPDLKNWKHLSDFGKTVGVHTGVWECPDLFPIYEEGTQKQYWVLLQSLNPGSPNGGSGTQYFVGQFNGSGFELDPAFAKSVENGKAVWLDWGRDNYAGVTWSDAPVSRYERLFIGWMSNWDYATAVPTGSWRSAMTLPRTIKLKRINGELRLVSLPAKQLKKLRQNSATIKKKTLNNRESMVLLSSGIGELDLQLTPQSASGKIIIEASNDKGETYRIGYDASQNVFFSDRTKSGDLSFSSNFATKTHQAPRLEKNSPVRMHLFFDRASCELFADQGAVCMTEIFFPSADYHTIKIIAEGATFDIQGKKYTLLNGE